MIKVQKSRQTTLSFRPQKILRLKRKPMIITPDFVLDYLIKNNFTGKTRTLLIGENYPNANYAKSYFYKSLPTLPGGPSSGAPGAFFTNLCDTLGIPVADPLGAGLTELQRLNMFLGSGFLVIDAQPNGAPPLKPTAELPNILSALQMKNLLRTIQLINPVNILFLTNNNISVVDGLVAHPDAVDIIPRIVANPLTGTNVFAFPSAPANPNIFRRQIAALIQNGCIL